MAVAVVGAVTFALQVRMLRRQAVESPPDVSTREISTVAFDYLIWIVVGLPMLFAVGLVILGSPGHAIEDSRPSTEWSVSIPVLLAKPGAAARPRTKIPAMATIEVSDELRAAATYFGTVGERWLDELPTVVASLEAEWGISAGRTLTGGNFAYVAEVVTAEGEPAVLKVAVPRGPTEFTQELRTLQLAQGDPYAGLIRFDEERRSLLLERLGRQMAELGWPVDRQLAAITETVARGWRPVNGDGLADGATKARSLADYIPRAWDRLGKPCAEKCIERAIEYAHQRARWLDGREPVLIHGDAHPWNVLELPGGGDTSGEGQQFRLIDPEGLASEPAHDLGVVLRGWNDELLEVADVAAATFERCASVGLRTGVDPEGMWRWSFIERVSSGLLLQELGHDADARSFLTVADRLVDAKPPWS